MSDKKPAISVIVPVYNAEETLEKTLKSILNQSFSDFELIVIDDSSSDNSRNILLSRMVDSRIKTFFLDKNGGVGNARNVGISNAEGKYLMFVDSDDLLEPDFMKKMYDKINKSGAQICVCGYYQDIYNNQGNMTTCIEVAGKEEISSGTKEILHMAVGMDESKCFAYLWNKLFLTELIRNNGIFFNTQNFGEDFLFNISAFRQAEKVVYLSDMLYHYTELNQSSLCQKYIPTFYDIILHRYRLWVEWAQSAGEYEGDVRTGISNVHIKHLLACFIRECDKRSGKNMIQLYQQTKKRLSDPETKEACKYSKAVGKQKLLNGVCKTRNAVINQMFAQCVWFVKYKFQNVFDKLK